MPHTILAFGPHPDDVELGLGGTVAALVQQGHRVVLVDMTSGEPTPFGDENIRPREAALAAGILGVTRVALGLKNREVVATLDARHRVAALLRQYRPEIVFLPYPQDAHPDHLACTRIIEDARFDAKLTQVAIPGMPFHCRRLMYYFCTHLRALPAAALAFDISAYMPQKLAALECYQSQFYTGRTGPDAGAVIRQVTTANAYFGGLIGREYAEPLAVQELLGVDSVAGWLI